MLPSQAIISESNQTYRTIDKKGRQLLLRRLTALDTLRLFKAAGPLLAQNEPWLSMAGLALSVMEIDNIPIPAPTTELQIESLIDRLGESGLAAIVDTIKEEDPTTDPRVAAGNSPGTPS